MVNCIKDPSTTPRMTPCVKRRHLDCSVAKWRDLSRQTCGLRCTPLEVTITWIELPSTHTVR